MLRYFMIAPLRSKGGAWNYFPVLVIAYIITNKGKPSRKVKLVRLKIQFIVSILVPDRYIYAAVKRHGEDLLRWC